LRKKGRKIEFHPLGRAASISTWVTGGGEERKANLLLSLSQEGKGGKKKGKGSRALPAIARKRKGRGFFLKLQRRKLKRGRMRGKSLRLQLLPRSGKKGRGENSMKPSIFFGDKPKKNVFCAGGKKGEPTLQHNEKEGSPLPAGGAG